MGIAERKEAQKEALRKKIFDAASNIIVNEGYDKLSIRKIAKEIEYSPAVIYNYFKDKSDIIECIMSENYNKILTVLRSLDIKEKNPETTLRTGLTKYISLMIENPQQYLAMISNTDNKIIKGFSIFKNSDGDNTEAKNMLLNTVNIGIEQGVFKKIDVNMLSSIVWSTCYGIISCIVIQNLTDKKYIEEIIDNYVDIIIKGILIEK